MIRPCRVDPRARWLLGGVFVSVACTLLMTFPVAAQEAIIFGDIDIDWVRASGFFWRGEVNGSIGNSPLGDLPDFVDPIDVTDDLGVDDGATGWLIDGDFGVARRHRLLVSFSGLAPGGTTVISTVDDGGVPLDVLVDTRLSMRDFHGAYNFLYSTRAWMDAGVIGGVGYVASSIDIVSNVGDQFNEFNSPYALIGGNVRLKSQDVISIYAELTGFPSVEAGGQSGWVMDLEVEFLVYPTPNIGVIAGYKRYQLSLDGTPDRLGMNLVWDGYVLGGQYRF